jgi:outer membrane protein assembly factor BamB
MAIAMAAATFWSTAGGVSAEPSMQARFFEQAALAQTNTVALEGAWMKAALREGKAELLSLSLDKALQNQEFLVQILRAKLTGTAAQGWTPRLNRAVHDLDIQSYEAKAEGGGTRIRVKANVVFRFDGDLLGRQAMGGAREVAGTLTLDLEAKAGAVTGNYALDGGQTDQNRLRSVKGKVTGSLAEVSTPPAPNAAAWMPSGKDSMSDLYELATAAERTADAWYQRLRALELARRMNRAYAETLADTVLPFVARPAIKFGGAVSDAGSAKDAGGEVSDDLLDDLGVTKANTRKGGAKSAGKAGSDAELQSGLAAMRNIAARVARMARLAEGLGAGGAHAAAAEASCDDPEFGPWYGDTYLPPHTNGVHRLPADVGGAGPQDWTAVAGWKSIGPFPLNRFDSVVDDLPDMVWLGNEACELQSSRFSRKAAADSPFEWQAARPRGMTKDLVGGFFGYFMPPRWFSGSPHSSGLAPMLGYREYLSADGAGGLADSTAYARCVIESPRDVELWAGLGLNRQGRLWVNDRLVWSGPAEPAQGTHETAALVRLPLRKGENELVLRVDTDYSTPYWWLRLCMRGEPRPAAEVKAKADAVAALRRQFKPDPAVGWRGDGAGTALPGCNPPVAWNQKTKQNVLWSVPMPYIGSGNAVPAPGTNRLFVGLDPHWLLCLDKDSGKELWRRPVTVIDLLDDAERTKGKALVEAWWQAMQDVSSMPLAKVGGNYYTGFPKWLHYQRYWAEETGIWTPARGGEIADERKGASPELIVLLDKRDELQKADDPVSVQEQLNQVLKQIEKAQAEAGANDPDSRQAKNARFTTALNALWGFMSKHVGRWCYGGSAFGYWPDYAPWMYPTPVTDGKHVWVKSGFMAAACFDMDGNEVWKVALEGPGVADKVLSSPRLVDGKLIMQVLNREREGGSVHGGLIRLIALDAATGRKLWSAPVDDYNWNAATPAVLRLTDGRETMSVLVTPEGSVVRADDGKVLVRDSGSQCCFDSPLVVNGDTVIFGHGALNAVRFIMKSRDQVGHKRLWTQRGNSHGVLNCGGCISAGGRVYYTSRDGDPWGNQEAGTPSLNAPPGASEGWKTMVVHDMAGGREVARLLALRKGGNQYSPASASDRHVYQIDGDHIFQHILPKAPMDMVVVTRGDHPIRLANNAIDRTYGSGIIEGDRIYIRGYYWVTCVGYTGEEGRKFEARTVARNLLDDVYAGRPGEFAAFDAPMAASSTINFYTYQHPRNIYSCAGTCRLRSGHAPHRWWVLGPVPKERAAAAIEASGGPAGPKACDETVTVEGKEYGWGPLYQEYLKLPDFKSWELDPANFADIHRLRRVVDLSPLVKAKGPGTFLLTTDLESEAPQTMRFEQTEPGIRAWVGGKEVRHGERIRFAKGFCRLFLEVEVEAPPAQGPFISPRFWASEDVEKERTAWVRAVERRKSYLEDAIRLAPESAEATAAKRLLQDAKP